MPGLATRGARAIGEAILEDWLIHSEGADYVDDVTVLVLVTNQLDAPESHVEE
jgi:hypothetical protein